VKVLLVDDEERFVSMMVRRLRLRGIDADCAFSGEEALAIVKEARFDVGLLDVKMPGIGGIELRRRLHEIDPDMKFIFLTGHGSNDDFVVGSTEGSFYLTKPLRLDKLIEIIKEVLK
jgi:DNA-binding response OmpR family regulator